MSRRVVFIVTAILACSVLVVGGVYYMQQQREMALWMRTALICGNAYQYRQAHGLEHTVDGLQEGLLEKARGAGLWNSQVRKVAERYQAARDFARSQGWTKQNLKAKGRYPPSASEINFLKSRTGSLIDVCINEVPHHDLADKHGPEIEQRFFGQGSPD